MRARSPRRPSGPAHGCRRHWCRGFAFPVSAFAVDSVSSWAPYYPAMATEANRTNQAEMATSDCTRWPPFVISVILPGIPGAHNRPREALETVACEGGTVTAGKCTCPAEFKFLPASSGTGGSCVRSNAENCRGGDLTAGGSCLCSGRVTMSGETYALEFLSGKCVPK